MRNEADERANEGKKNMSRSLLVLATILGLNAGNVPGTVGDAIKNFGSAGTEVASMATSVMSNVSDVANVDLGSLTNLGNVAQASMLGGASRSVKPIYVKSGISFGKGSPINVAETRVRARNGGGIGSLGL